MLFLKESFGKKYNPICIASISLNVYKCQAQLFLLFCHIFWYKRGCAIVNRSVLHWCVCNSNKHGTQYMYTSASRASYWFSSRRQFWLGSRPCLTSLESYKCQRMRGPCAMATEVRALRKVDWHSDVIYHFNCNVNLTFDSKPSTCKKVRCAQAGTLP